MDKQAMIDARKRANLKRAEAAKAIGVSWETLWKWEQGKMVPSGPHLVKLARLYGIDPATLVQKDTPT